MRTLVITRQRAAILAAVTCAVLAAVAPSALAATPLTGERLSGSGTATTSGHCSRPVYGSGTFSVSGSATGPFPGTFTETGSYSFSGPNQPYYVHFGATFTLTSGSTTITGNVAFRYPGAWLVEGCPDASLINLPVTYTAVIGGQKYGGPAKATVSAGAGATVAESFTG